MKYQNILLFALMMCCCFTASTQELPDFLSEYLTDFENDQSTKSNEGILSTPDEYLLIATRLDIWDATLGIWQHQDSSEISYFDNSLTAEWLYKKWNNGVVENNIRYLYEYNDAGQRISYTQESWDGSEWSPAEENLRILNTFEDGLQTQYQRQSWTNGNWEDDDLRIYTYWPDTDLLASLISLSRSQDGTLQNTVRFDYNYNEEGNRLIETRAIWDDSEEAWSPADRREYTYNENQDLITEIFYKAEEGEWIPFRKEDYIYNSTNQLIEENQHIWLTIDQAWEFYQQYIHIYNDEGDLSRLDIFSIIPGNPSYPILVSQIQIGYDENGNRIYYTYSNAPFTGAPLEYSFRRDYTYDEISGQTATYSEGYWDAETDSWENEKIVYYYYELNTLSEVEDTKVLLEPAITLYPNPANDVINIFLTGYIADKEKIHGAIIDASGITLRQFIMSTNEYELNVSGIASGIYWVKLGNSKISTSIAIVIK